MFDRHNGQTGSRPCPPVFRSGDAGGLLHFGGAWLAAQFQGEGVVGCIQALGEGARRAAHRVEGPERIEDGAADAGYRKAAELDALAPVEAVHRLDKSERAMANEIVEFKPDRRMGHVHLADHIADQGQVLLDDPVTFLGRQGRYVAVH